MTNPPDYYLHKGECKIYDARKVNTCNQFQFSTSPNPYLPNRIAQTICQFGPSVALVAACGLPRYTKAPATLSMTAGCSVLLPFEQMQTSASLPRTISPDGTKRTTPRQ
jgi:hypothetical protein